MNVHARRRSDERAKLSIKGIEPILDGRFQSSLNTLHFEQLPRSILYGLDVQDKSKSLTSLTVSLVFFR